MDVASARKRRRREKKSNIGSKIYVYMIERKDNRRFDGDDCNGEVCFC